MTEGSGEMETLEAPRFPPFPNPEEGFRTVVADPPWKYEDDLPGGEFRGAIHHYPTLPTGAIMGLGDYVQEITAPAAHCYLWTTGTHLDEAFDVLDAWGFTHKQTLTWVKTYGEPDGLPHERQRPARVKSYVGMGRYYRNSTEFVLFGIKGNLGVERNDVPTHFFAEVGDHSEKPDKSYRLFEQMSPGPRFEMFARSGRPGWVTWGDEAPEDELHADPLGRPTVNDAGAW